jgi:hypothetical protein
LGVSDDEKAEVEIISSDAAKAALMLLFIFIFL